MFQFTDDDDPDFEGLLDLPLDKSTVKSELDSKRVQEDNLKDTLDDFDDNELILSMMETVDGSANQSSTKQSPNDTDFKNFDTVTAAHVSPVKNSRQSPTNNIATNNVKHKSSSVEPCISKIPRVEYERKFPGPAGLIAKKSLSTTPVKYQLLPDGSPKQADLPPTMSKFLFENGCWDQLISDCETISPRLSAIIDSNCVASIRRMNIGRSKPRKLQFFAALIVHVDCSACDPSIVLEDSTGEMMHGTFHKTLWETHGNVLTVGTAILLKQVSVVSISNSRKLYINITSNNILKLYTPRSGAPILVTEVAKISTEDFTSQVKKNERLVFEETHPNIPKTIKDVPAVRKPSLPKTDNFTSQVKKNERLVFEETHSNIPKTIKDVPALQKPSLPKTDKINQTNTEKISIKVDSKTPTDDTLVHSANSIKNLAPEGIFGDLEGIDADSLFGEF